MILEFKNAVKSQATILVLIGVVGMVLLRAVGHRFLPLLEVRSFSDDFFAFILGIMLVSLALVGIISNFKRTVRLDSNQKVMTLIDTHTFGGRVTTIPFSDIKSVHVSSFRVSSLEAAYDVIVTRNDGRRVSLFLAGYFKGRYSKRVAEENCRKIVNFVKGVR